MSKEKVKDQEPQPSEREMREDILFEMQKEVGAVVQKYSQEHKLKGNELVYALIRVANEVSTGIVNQQMDEAFGKK